MKIPPETIQIDGDYYPVVKSTGNPGATRYKCVKLPDGSRRLARSISGRAWGWDPPNDLFGPNWIIYDLAKAQPEKYREYGKKEIKRPHRVVQHRA